MRLAHPDCLPFCLPACNSTACRNFSNLNSPKTGLAPGTLVYLGEKRVDKVSIHIMDYDAESLNEVTVTRPEKCEAYIHKPTVTWMHVAGSHDISIVEKFGKMLNVHDLVLEDVLNTAQRPKFELHDDLIFVVVKMLRWIPEEDDVLAEHVAVLLGPGYVLTFQEAGDDIFGDVRDRIRTTTGRAPAAWDAITWPMHSSMPS